MPRYTTLKAVKIDLDIPEEKTNDDRLLVRLIGRASRAVKNHIGDREIEKQTHTEILNGTGLREIKLNHYPVNEIKNVWIDSESDFGSSTKEDAENYKIDKNTGVLSMTSEEAVWPHGKNNIKVKYDAGYDPIPEPIEEATIITVGSKFNKSKNISYGLSSESEDDVSLSWDGQNIPDEAQDALARFQSENAV